MSNEIRGQALAMAKAYNTDGLLRVELELAAQQLDSWGLFSLPAIAAILQCTEYRIRDSVRFSKGLRGSLNPHHIDYLMYMLDGTVRPHWLKIMLDGGTTINTISRLTGISRSTLHRKVWDGRAASNLQ